MYALSGFRRLYGLPFGLKGTGMWIYHESKSGPRCGLGYVLNEGTDKLLVLFIAYASASAYPEYRVVEKRDCYALSPRLAGALFRFPSSPIERKSRFHPWYGEETQEKHCRTIHRMGSIMRGDLREAKNEDLGPSGGHDDSDVRHAPAGVRIYQAQDGHWYDFKGNQHVAYEDRGGHVQSFGAPSELIVIGKKNGRKTYRVERERPITHAPRYEDVIARDALREATLTFMSGTSDEDKWAAARLRSVLAGNTAKQFCEATGVTRRQLQAVDRHIRTMYTGSLYPRSTHSLLLTSAELPKLKKQKALRSKPWSICANQRRR